MGEASEAKAILEDIEEDTFIRFWQFAYTGDYATPNFTYISTIELPNIPTPYDSIYALAKDCDGRSTEPGSKDALGDAIRVESKIDRAFQTAASLAYNFFNIHSAKMCL
jgi:hypothetical protein